MAKPSKTASGADDVSLLLEDQLCFALYSAARSVQKLYRAGLDPLGLTYPQYLVLLVLWEGDDLSVSDIGSRLFLDSATLTPLLRRMEKAELVERHRSSDDERRVLISLTRKGNRLQPKVRRVTQAVTCAAAEASAQPARLLKSLNELRDGLRASD